MVSLNGREHAHGNPIPMTRKERKTMLTRTLDSRAKATPRYISKGHYMIDSDTATLKAYNLRQNQYGAWECDCPHYAVHHECKHERRLADLLAPPTCSQCGKPYGDNECRFCNPDVHTIVPPAEKPVRPYTLESIVDDYYAALEVPGQRKAIAKYERRERVKEAW